MSGLKQFPVEMELMLCWWYYSMKKISDGAVWIEEETIRGRKKAV